MLPILAAESAPTARSCPALLSPKYRNSWFLPPSSPHRAVAGGNKLAPRHRIRVTKLSSDELTIRLPGDFLVQLPAARRMKDVRPANADVSDGLDSITDCHVEGVARGDTTDVAKQPLGLRF